MTRTIALARIQVGVDTLIRATWPLLLGIAGWTGSMLMDHDRRLTSIEAARPIEAQLVAEVRAELKQMRAEQRADLGMLRDELRRSAAGH